MAVLAFCLVFCCCQDPHNIFRPIGNIESFYLVVWPFHGFSTNQICTQIVVFFPIWMKEVCIPPCQCQSILVPFHYHRNFSSHSQQQDHVHHHHPPTLLFYNKNMCCHNRHSLLSILEQCDASLLPSSETLAFHVPLYCLGLPLLEISEENLYLMNSGVFWVYWTLWCTWVYICKTS